MRTFETNLLKGFHVQFYLKIQLAYLNTFLTHAGIRGFFRLWFRLPLLLKTSFTASSLAPFAFMVERQKKLITKNTLGFNWNILTLRLNPVFWDYVYDVSIEIEMFSLETLFFSFFNKVSLFISQHPLILVLLLLFQHRISQRILCSGGSDLNI